MANEQRFLGKAGVYEQYRPSYPIELIDYLCAKLSDEANSLGRFTIADIGAGTGLFTRLLLERGFHVIAIEPNDDMLIKLNALIEQYPTTLTIKKASAEETGLESTSIDMIVCAQAFHWVDEIKARVEWMRILKPSGYAALIWNQRAIEANDFMYSYEKLFLSLEANSNVSLYKNVGHQYVNQAALKPFFGELPHLYRTSLSQPLDEQGFIGRVLSSSYAPREGDEHYNKFVEQVKLMYRKYKDEHSNTVNMIYDSVCYIQRFI